VTQSVQGFFALLRIDNTGLYYYSARYYDPMIGRFINPDIILLNPTNPQSFNRYSYCLNNPLKYMDPIGHQDWTYLEIAKWVSEHSNE
jgi:RHS repeat-associated protein